MIRPLDAWRLRRLLTGQSLNGEMDGVSEPFRGLAEQLAALPLGDRQSALERLLDGRQDKNEIIVSMSQVDLDARPLETPESIDHPRRLSGVPSWSHVPAGTVLWCHDRPSHPSNFGKVITDHGDECEMVFRESEEFETRKRIKKNCMTFPDGSELTAETDGLDENGWSLPTLNEMPDVPPFPVEIFPEPVARLIIEGSDAIGCPRDFLAAATLGVVAGVIGRSVHLRMKPQYFAGPTLFIANVGPPSDGKSPALKIVTDAVRRIDHDLKAEHDQAMTNWKREIEGLEKGKKGPPPPKPRRIDVDDITMEVLPNLLSDNPRGLVMIRDELMSFIKGMNQFKGGKGNDRPNILKIWSGEAIKKDRVGNEHLVPIRCNHPCLSIIGGLTPDMLGELLDPKGRSDGFLERFLFAYPDPHPIPLWTDKGVCNETSEDWFGILVQLWKRSMIVDEGRTVPNVAKFTEEGRSRWREHYDRHAEEMNSDGFDPSMRGAWGKFREYAGRLALILGCLDHAANPLVNPIDVPSINPQVVENAWKLIDYFKCHTRRVHAVAASAAGFGGPAVKNILDWIRTGTRFWFSLRELKQARRTLNERDLSSALSYLIARNAVRLREIPAGDSKGGRPPSPVYDVNPALLDSQNPQNTQNSNHSGEESQRLGGSEGIEGSENG